ncbi:MAG TPA: alpha/beta hydrolase [Terriglobales bacterium]|nr:alpha/beta hydrolase [Terriglobales bacterium]
MSADDILSRAQPPADARIAYGSDANQFGELRLPVSGQHSGISDNSQHSAISNQEKQNQKQERRKAQGQRQAQGQRLHPVVMNIHGGFWRAKYDLLHASHLCAALTRAGVATWNLEYRRVGNPGGAWPGTFEDITNGFRFLKQIAGKYRLDMTRVVVMGHSAGGHLAMALAGHQGGHAGTRANGEPKLRGAVSLAGVVDLQRAWELHLSNDAVVEFLGGTPAQMPDHYREADPMRLTVKIEQHLIHGVDDDVVPIGISRKYAELKQHEGEKVQLTELPKTGHFEVIDPESGVWPVVEKAVMSMAKGSL